MDVKRTSVLTCDPPSCCYKDQNSARQYRVFVRFIIFSYDIIDRQLLRCSHVVLFPFVRATCMKLFAPNVPENRTRP